MTAKRKMSTREHLVEYAVGLFFVAALALLAFYTILLKSDEMFRERHDRSVEFTNIGGIQEGDKVLMRGLNVGKVGGMKIKGDGGTIELSLILGQELTFFNDYRIEIRSTSILGGRHVFVELGTRAAGVLPEGTALKGHAPVDIMDVMAEVKTFLNSFGGADSVFESVNGAATDIRKLTREVTDGKGTLHSLIYDDSLYNETKTAFKTFADAADSVKTAGDSVTAAAKNIEGVLAEGKTMFKDIKGVAETLDKAGVGVSQASKSLDTVAANLNGAITEAREGKGTVGKLLTDDALYNNLNAAADDLRSAAAKVASTDSSLGKVMNDDGALYDTMKDAFSSFNDTMTVAKEVAEKVKAGQGTVGLLLTDDALYNDLRNMVGSVRGAVNDFREQAPIVTFGSLLFGAF